MQLSVAEEREPLAVLCTDSEEGSGGRERVAATECLHQRPLLLCLQTTPTVYSMCNSDQQRFLVQST